MKRFPRSVTAPRARYVGSDFGGSRAPVKKIGTLIDRVPICCLHRSFPETRGKYVGCFRPYASDAPRLFWRSIGNTGMMGVLEQWQTSSMSKTVNVSVNKAKNLRVAKDRSCVVFTFSTDDGDLNLTVPAQELDSLMIGVSHASGAIALAQETPITKSFELERLNLHRATDRGMLVLELGIPGGWSGCFDLPLDRANELISLLREAVGDANVHPPSETRR